MKNMFVWFFVLLFSVINATPPPPTTPTLPTISQVENLLNTLTSAHPDCSKLWTHKDDPNTETRRECFDGKDNDEDGKTDCEDPDCKKDPRIRQRCMMMSKRYIIDDEVSTINPKIN